MLQLDLDEELELDEQDSIILISSLTSPKTITELLTEAEFDSLHESSRTRRHLSTVFNDQDKYFAQS